MSKRKLTWFVDSGLVDGWDDPRFPTVRGVLRRGMTIEALKQFIIAQGSSRSVVFMEWDKIWAMNKKVIDPVAPRFTTVDSGYNVVVNVAGVKEEPIKCDKHPKDPSVGQKTSWRSSRVLIDGADAEQLVEGTNATFINWGNIKIVKVNKAGGKVTSVDAEPNLDDKDFKKTLKVTWLADTDSAPFTPTTLVYYDHIISKPVLEKDDDFKNFIGKDTKFELPALGDPEFKALKKGDIIQIQRRGFFIVDQAYQAPTPNTCKPVPIKLIAIPDGTPGSYGPPGKPAPAPVAAPAKGKKGGAAPAAKAGKAAAPAQASAAGNNADAINDKVTAQGDLVRKLKGEKADKAAIDEAVKSLLALKAEYKAATGKDWKPGAHVSTASSASSAPAPSGGNEADAINDKITAQGDTVRKLKGEKADKAAIDAAVKTLLSLKADYKSATGKDWKPGAHVSSAPATAAPAAAAGNAGDALNDKVTAQGDLVRKLKGEKADKAVIDAAVKTLLALKADYKTATGKDWKPGAHKSSGGTAPASAPAGDAGSDLNAKIAAQGDIVRKLKGEKADKAAIDAAVKTLLALKADYKAATGSDWKPGAAPAAKKEASPASSASSASSEMSELERDLTDRIGKQGDIVRKLKGEKADKADVDANVKILLDLKAKFKEKLGRDFKPGGGGGGGGNGGGNEKKKDKKKEKKPQQPKKEEKKPEGGAVKQTKLGMEAKKEDNLADWYSQIIVKSELLEYYDVSGCYILRPWAFSIWERCQRFFDDEIKMLGVENCYFPMFVSHSALQKEKDHIADFSPEVAWVTKSGDTELAEPIAIRPTSETIMYPAFAKWIQSHRDLPLKINQWSNVVVSSEILSALGFTIC